MSKKFNKYSDEELVGLLNGNEKEAEAAFKVIYYRYSPQLHAYCMKIFNDESTAEDIFQETFMKFFQYGKNHRGKINIPGYLITIARNLSLNRKRKDERVIYTDDLKTSNGEHGFNEKKEFLDLISMALEFLEFHHKEAFVLKEYNGLTYEELAEVTGVTLNNAKSRVFRARKKIKKILKPYLKDLERHIK